MDTIYLIIASLIMLTGIIGVLIPVLPGIPIMFVVALIYGFVTKFQNFASSELIILGLIALLSLAVDYSSGVIAAKYSGASKRSLFFGFVGLIVGTIVLPPFGGIIGLFIAIFLAEILTHNNKGKAYKAAKGGLLGSLTGILINLFLAILFIILFIIFALK